MRAARKLICTKFSVVREGMVLRTVNAGHFSRRDWHSKDIERPLTSVTSTMSRRVNPEDAPNNRT